MNTISNNTPGPRPERHTAKLARCELTHIRYLMDIFAELVEPFGPLCHLRFDTARFTALMGPLLGTSDEEVIEKSFARHEAALATPDFVRQLQHKLRQFAQMDFVDESHKGAALMAISLTPLSPQGAGMSSPALYAIFRAQMLDACASCGVDVFALAPHRLEL